MSTWIETLRPSTPGQAAACRALLRLPLRLWPAARAALARGEAGMAINENVLRFAFEAAEQDEAVMLAMEAALRALAAERRR
jgi:hypothetical protein